MAAGLVAMGLLAATTGVFTSSRPPRSTPASAPHVSLVNEYCLSCHDDDRKKGELSLQAIAGDDVARHADVWEKVVRKLRARQMPPVGRSRPDDATYEAAIAYVVNALDRAAEADPNPGRTATIRRLTRTEYHNAVRDLLALDVDVTTMLPGDESSYGFDNVTVGDLSPTLLDRYISAAEKISRLAIGSPSRSPGGDTIRVQTDLTQEEHLPGLPIGTRGGVRVPYTFPRDGEYDIQIRLARDRNEHVEGLNEAHELELLLDGAGVRRFTVKPPERAAGFSEDYQPSHDRVDRHLEARVPVSAGPHAIGVTFVKKPSALLETVRQPYQSHFNSYRHPRIQPAVYSVTIIGPYGTSRPGETPSRQAIFGTDRPAVEDEDAAARRILSKLLRKAYRRPVSDADIQGPFDLYLESKKEGGFDAGIEMALSAVLVSPQFLFRVEQDAPAIPANTPYRVSDLELASRLSFFLWSSIPDEELLDAAAGGKLHERAELTRQVRRMLADTRSKALVSNFASQWLHLRNLDSMTPDMRLFPDFDDNLRQAFRQETELFIENVLREDRPVLELLNAKYTFVNERLAKHYGIPNVYGSRFRRIDLGADSWRGGLLRQGSILTVTSYATRTSPVIRGKWVLDNLLAVPPPPPPPDVPTLKDNTVDGRLSVRSRLAEHRSNPACSSCHNLMDPVGLSLEKYDAVGRRRAAEGGAPIDVSGGLPDGQKFDDVNGLEAALLRRPELFVGAFTEKLLTYALGRGVESYDAPAVRAIVREAGEAPAQEFRISSIILGVVNSQPFQMRKSP
jgi:mono/diheme cytochrome c family protein